MNTYKLKSVARRGSMLGAAFAIVAASFVPAITASADALNPLTERSLTLSSGSPGWSNKDGSGNSTYAQPNSGANGEKTGNTFAFRVSSTETVKAFDFQYCTKSAGECVGPGNNTGDDATRAVNDATMYDDEKSDLEVVTSTPTEVSLVNYGLLFNTTTGQPSSVANVPSADNSEGNYIVLHKTLANDPWTRSDAVWTMAATEKQTADVAAVTTNKANYITLTSSTGELLTAGDYVKVIFFGTDSNYITNPGANEFFVKINTFKSDTLLDDANRVDGGVTVANVMNRSIEIQTKVLETMDFSVGTVDPNTLDSTDTDAGTPDVQSQFTTATGRSTHGVCDPVITGMTEEPTTPNVLQLGNETGEFSLETRTTYSTHSYWRLSSNSSAGATVYYSGVTLSNTVNDQIRPINNGNGIATAPTPGSEQFGLALDNGTDFTVGSDYRVSYERERDTSFLYQNGADNDVIADAIHTASLTANNVVSNGSWHEPQLAPLVPYTDYRGGTGNVNAEHYGTVNTTFAFKSDSNLIPEPIASNSDEVVDCVTGKMRYIANIAATTPAGIYTTKINYIAAPQY